MIQVDLFLKDKIYVGYESQGHAETEEDYSDGVCSAVSALIYTVAETMLETLQVKAQIEEEEGRFYFMTKEAHREDVQLLFQTLKTGLLGIHREYPEYISVFVKEVPC